MKKLIVIVFLAAVVLAGAPFGLGFEVEHRYRVLLAQFEEAGYQLSEHEYQRGVFDASAKSTFKVPMYSVDGQRENLEFTLVSQVYHGPFSPAVGWFGQVARIDTKIFYEDKPVFPEHLNAQLITDLMFSGDGQSRFELPALAEPMALDGGSELTFSGFSGVIDFNVVNGHLSLDLQSEGLSIDAPGQGQLTVKGLKAESESNRSIEDLMLGDGQFTVETITFNDMESGFAINLQGLEIAAETSAAENTIDMLLRYAVDAIELPGETLGRSVLEVEFKSIDAKAMAAIQQGIKDFQADNSASEDQKMAALLGVMMGAMPALMQRDPSISIKTLDIATPAGSVLASLSVGTQGMTVLDINSPLMALPKVVASASVTLPESLVREALFDYLKPSVALEIAMSAQEGSTLPDVDTVTHERVEAQLQELIAQQLIKQEGDTLVSVAAVKAGNLTVNGQSLSLPPM